MHVAAITHDHGRDISNAIDISGCHSILCFDHELDLTVNYGIEHCSEFAVLFKKAQVIVTTIRSSNNLYRTLRDEQVLQRCVSFILTWHVFCVSFHVQLELWTYESVPMVIPSQFVKTRWQSKYKMLRSVMANKVKVRAMCHCADEECKALQGCDLADNEWKWLEVGKLSVFQSIRNCTLFRLTTGSFTYL